MRRETRSASELHSDWLSQVDTEGPFLSLPVIKDMWPSGVDRLGDTDDRLITFKQAFVQWQRALDQYAQAPKTLESRAKYEAIQRAWIDTVLDDLAEWDGLRATTDAKVQSPGDVVTVSASSALEGHEDALAALLLIAEPTTGLRDKGLDGWAATEIDRMSVLLRKAQVDVGIVTDGQWWAIVWAKDATPTGSGMVNALTWGEEPLVRDAFLTLINQRRFRAANEEHRLSRLFERSELEAEEITEVLGTQVRKSVELLVQAFSEARLEAAKHGDADPLAPRPDDVYQASVTIMMRIVFLLFAEERDMLPTEQLYWASYAIKDLLGALKEQAAHGEEHLDESFDAWHRLLAVSDALFFGVNYDEMRMPAYGGSLLDPARFPWLHATDRRGLRVKVSDRVMLHALESVQTVVVSGERRRISFSAIDVEQIGYIYEGLLGYSCAEVEDEVVLGLVGKDGEEPEIDAASLQEIFDDSPEDGRAFATALSTWCKDAQPAATSLTPARLARLYDQPVDKAEMRRLLTPFAGGDEDLLGFLIDWSNFIRRDLRGIPLVVPVGGLVVVETPSRRNAGAHYTPRTLAEEVVQHALEPLVFEPGPLQSNDESDWQLKSSAEILDLKVADIAAGSGAFLVAAARFLSEKLIDAWQREGFLGDGEANPRTVSDRATREVIARCLYGADINPMAVEMCKLSLWLISMDKTKPFSFVDDKIFCGNSLLGLTTLDQLRYLHLYPKPSSMSEQLLVDVSGKIEAVTRIRKELASPVDERDPMRSSRGKQALLEQARAATQDLRMVADGIIAAGLSLGGKPGRPLDDAFKVLNWELMEALPADGENGNDSKLQRRIQAGLTPTVKTDYERWQPLHWVLEAPDVIVERGGFDAVIGNPPFMYGREISGAYGPEMRAWLVNAVAGGTGGVADICAYFFLQVRSLLKQRATTGLIATNTIAQGDTRTVGLDQMVGTMTIIRAVRSMKWPTASANLEVALVWAASRGSTSDAPRLLDNVPVRRINTLLEPVGSVSGKPYRLAANGGIAFMGANINGVGFLMDPDTAAEMIRLDSENADVLFPYLTGEDLNSSLGAASRWAVNFGDMSQGQAEHFAAPYAWIEQNLRPHRLKLVKKPRLQQKWWIYESRAAKLYEAMADMTSVLAISLVSKHLVPTRVTTEQVFSHRTGVFITSEPSDLALLNSDPHVLWARTYGSTLETRLNYSLTDVFGTFPRPLATSDLDDLGTALDELRGAIRDDRRIGLTDLYNLVNNPMAGSDADIAALRSLHAAIDAAVMSAYGWSDVELNHGHHVYRQVERWTVSPSARVEILDKLLAENHLRASAEGQDVPAQGGLD